MRHIILVLILIRVSVVSYGQNPELTIQNGHSASVTVMAFSCDGKYLATAGEDNIIIIWDFRLGKQIKILKGHHQKINDVQFLNKSYNLFSCSNDGQLIYWDVYNGEPKQSIQLDNPVLSVDVSSDDSLLVAAGYFMSIKCWKIGEKLEFVRNIPAWSKSDSLKLMQLIIKKNHLKRFKKVNKKMIAEFQNKFSPSPAASSVVFGNGNNDLIVARGIQIAISKELLADLDVVHISDEGNIFATLNRKTDILYHRTGDNNIYGAQKPSTLYKYDFNKSKVKYSRPGDMVSCDFTSISVNANDSLLAAVSEDGNIFLWKTNGRYCRIFKKKVSKFRSLVFHPVYRNLLITGNESGDVAIMDVYTGNMIRKLESGIYPLKNLTVNPSGNMISISSSGNIISTFDLNDRVTITGFAGNKKKISGLHFISDTVLVSAGGDNRIRFYDIWSNSTFSIKGNRNPMLVNGILDFPVYSMFLSSLTSYGFALNYFRGSIESLDATAIAPDNKLFATGGVGFKNGILRTIFQPRIFPVHILNVQERKKLNTISAHYVTIVSLGFNRNSTLLASCGLDNKTGSIVGDRKLRASYMADAMLLQISGEYTANLGAAYKGAYINRYSSMKIWDPAKKMPLATFEFPWEIKTMIFSPVNDSIVFTDEKSNVVLFDYKNKKAEKITRGYGPLFFSSEGRQLFYQDSTHTLIQYDLYGRKDLVTYNGHSDSITAALITPDTKHVVTTSLDGSMKIWDAATGKEKATVYAMNGSDFIIKTPDYYYYATKNAKKEIGFTFGIKFYPFEQYDLQYNRPDIVLERLGMASPEMVRALNLAYQKRLQKSGFSEEMFGNDFHLPEIRIKDSDKLPVSTTEPSLTLNLKATDGKYKLDRINIWVNDVALYGANGFSLRGNNISEYDGNTSLMLSRGINRIRVSCMNEKGVESLRETAEILYVPSGSEKPDLHLIVIGASEYADNDWNLNYAAKDAQDVATLFGTRKGDYNKINTTILVNRDVNRENILKLRQYLMNTNVNDLVLVFYAGHGLLDENLDYYLATYDIDFTKPSVNGLSYGELNSLLDSIPAREKILLIDACHSGEVDKEETVLADATVSKDKDIVFRGVRPRGYHSNANISYNNSFELMKEMFSDLRKGTGAMVISSAGGGEFAFEGTQWKNGVFTWSLREGLMSERADMNKDDIITVSELQNYILNNVTKLTNGKQKPTMRQENIENDFVIWRKN